MIVSHSHGFIFLKTRKTAGTSLEIGLSEYCGPDDIITPISPEDEETRQAAGFRGPQNHVFLRPLEIGGKKKKAYANHDPAGVLAATLPKDVWRGYFKFTIERNPFDKAISRYWWQMRGNPRPPPIGAFLERCEDYLLSSWPIYTIDDRLAVDHVMRFEDMASELERLQTRLGIGPIRMVRAKASYRRDSRPYREVLSPPDRAIIERVCARELDHFGYAW